MFVERANRVVLLCYASKFGRRSLTLVAPLNRINVLVSDRAPADGLTAALQRAAVRNVLADPTVGIPAPAACNSSESMAPDV